MPQTLPFPPFAAAPKGTPPDALTGTPYRVIAPLGRGAMGEVVEAEHVALAKRVVVKLLHHDVEGRPELVDRMRLEGQALAHLQHPNIVAVTDLQMTPNGRPYLVMERLEGRTLEAELRERCVLPVAEAVSVALSALAGLAAAHAAGIVHRDVKPANIFLCDATDASGTRVVKLLDFGMAKVVEQRGRGPAQLKVRTDDGVALGTPRFFSPEQAAFGPVDARTDVYAMGAVVYAMVAGRSPFEHLTELADLLAAHLATAPAPPSAYAPQLVPLDLEAVILHALSKRPADRFQSAAELAAALAETLRPKARWAPADLLAASAVAAPFASSAMRPSTPVPASGRTRDSRPSVGGATETGRPATLPPDPHAWPGRR